MSREIKFRAWNLETKRMQSGECLEWVSGEFIAGVWDFNEEHIAERQETTVMQYTGLKDLNDVEIYEGDIVKDSYGGVAVVTWYSNTAAFNCKYSDAGIGMYDFGNSLEVIGNVYENPKLMQSMV